MVVVRDSAGYGARGWFAPSIEATQVGVYSIQAHDTSQPLLEDSAVMAMIDVDLDIDGDHSNGDFGGPDRDEFEESIEEISPGPAPHQAHKHVLVNDYHEKGSFIPGYANFEALSQAAPGTISFTPVEVQLLTLDIVPEVGSTSIEVEVHLPEVGDGLFLRDTVHCTPIEVNVDVDNFNNSGYETSVHENEAEDHYEDYIDGTNHVGRIIVCNDNDTDHDGIPGFADGYGLFDLPEYQASTNTLFVPIVFELPAPIDHERARVRLTYDASDPLGVTTNSAGGYLLPDSGKLRLWTKEGGEARDGRPAVEGGDFLAVGEYSAAEFGFTNNNTRVLTYYIETVRPSEEVGDIRILFEVQPDERTGFMAADAVRLTALQMQFIIPDIEGGKLPTQFVPVSDPRPVVVLDDLKKGDVAVAGGTASFTISGEVTDAVADIIPDNLADIETVRVLVNDEEYIAPTALGVGDGGESSFWRRHPFRGTFGNLQVSLPVRGTHVVTVETSENAAGNKGSDSVLVSFHSSEEIFFGGTNFTPSIYIATNLTGTAVDAIQYLYDSPEPYEEAPWLGETSVGSLVFTGRLDEVSIEVSISDFSGLTSNVDSFVAELRYDFSTSYQPVYSNLFVETSATSGVFRSNSSFAITRGDLSVAVRQLDGTLPGTCVPAVERIRGPAPLLGSGALTIGFLGEQYELEEEDGWFYPKGGSPRYWVVYEISMRDHGEWEANTSVTVEYFVRDILSNDFPGADKVRLLRPVVIAIGDSLTFGYMRDATGNSLTPNWSQYWDTYPSSNSWKAINDDHRVAVGLPVPAIEKDICNQGWRGYLERELAPAGFIWLGEETSGHGPKHCGYSGAKTGHIIARLRPGNAQYRPMPAAALQTAPCYAIVIYLIGVNDCIDSRRTRDRIINEWKESADSVLTERIGKGKTVFVQVTIPKEDSPYREYDINNTDKLEPLNKAIRSYKNELPHVRQIVADCEQVAHDIGDDGLHFLPAGYGRIKDIIFASIKNGLPPVAE